MINLRNRLLLLTGTVFWVIIVFTFSSQPLKEQDIKPKLKQWISSNSAEQLSPNVTFYYHNTLISGRDNPFGFIEFIIRKCAHMFEYGMLAFLVYCCLSFINRIRFRVSLVLVFVVVTACFDEWNQSHISERTSTILDVGVDTLGATIAVTMTLMYSVYRRYKVNRNGKAISSHSR